MREEVRLRNESFKSFMGHPPAPLPDTGELQRSRCVPSFGRCSVGVGQEAKETGAPSRIGGGHPRDLTPCLPDWRITPLPLCLGSCMFA